VPRARSATFEIQRDAILVAAAKLFAERGFPAASVADLAGALGVSKALLYHYYRDKEQLLADIVDRYLDSLVALVDDAQTRRLSGEARLRDLIDRFMSAYEHSAAFHRVLVQDIKFLNSAHHGRALAKQRVVVEAFAQAVREAVPELEGSNLLKPVTMMLFGIMNWTFTWLRADGTLTYAALAPVITGMFLRGVQDIASARCAPEMPRRVSEKSGRGAVLATTRPRVGTVGRASLAQIEEN
jgi:AcrR family transcriptional regulator